MKWGLTPFLVLLMGVAQAVDPAPLFVDDFEAHTAGQVPGPPWKEEIYRSGAIIQVDGGRVFSGRQALHVTAPRGANYRRGYVAIHLGGPLPQLQAAMYGRAMVWLDEMPEPAPRANPAELPDEPGVHWTLLQGEGRSADDRYNSIYRLGLEHDNGTQFMANFETTPPVRTDCRQQSKRTLPVRRWACVEWHLEVATQELEFWLDGVPVVQVRGRADSSASCKGNDLAGEWRAPPKFDSFYIGFERYADSVNDQDLWIDDVELERWRIGCPGVK